MIQQILGMCSRCATKSICLSQYDKVYTIALNLTLNSEDELARVNQQPTSTPSIGCQLYDDSVVIEPSTELMYGFTLVTSSVRSKS